MSTSKYRGDGSLKPAAVRWKLKTISKIIADLDPTDIDRIDTGSIEVTLALFDNIRKRQIRRREEGNDPDTVRSTFCPPTVDEST